MTSVGVLCQKYHEPNSLQNSHKCEKFPPFCINNEMERTDEQTDSQAKPSQTDPNGIGFENEFWNEYGYELNVELNVKN